VLIEQVRESLKRKSEEVVSREGFLRRWRSNGVPRMKVQPAAKWEKSARSQMAIVASQMKLSWLPVQLPHEPEEQSSAISRLHYFGVLNP
jgi:hypothetical protein